MIPLGQGLKMLNPFQVDERLVIPGTASENINNTTLQLTVPLGPIDFEGEANEADGTRPTYNVVGGVKNETTGFYGPPWVFKKISHGDNVPTDVIRATSITRNSTETTTGDVVVGLTGGKIDPSLLPASLVTGIEYKGFIELTADGDDSDLPPAPEAGAKWRIQIPTGSVGPFTMTLVDDNTDEYILELNNNDHIVWSSALGRWDLQPYSNQNLMGKSFTVNLPISGSIGGYAHGDNVYASDDIVDVIERLLTERGPFVYVQPTPSFDFYDNTSGGGFNFGDSPSANLFGSYVVPIGYEAALEGIAVENYINKNDYGYPSSLSIEFKKSIGGGALTGGMALELNMKGDGNTDESIAEDSIRFPGQSLSWDGGVYIPASGQGIETAFNLNAKNDYFYVKNTIIYKKPPVPATDNVGPDPNELEGITKVVTKTVKAKRLVFAGASAGEITDFATDAKNKFWDQASRAYINDNGAATLSVDLSGKDFMWIAVPANVQVDKNGTFVDLGSFKDTFATNSLVVHEDISVNLVEKFGMNNGAMQSYRIYKLLNGGSYDAGYALTVELKADVPNAWW